MSTQMDNQKIRWPSLMAYGMRLVSVVLPTGEKRLLMLGGDKQAEKISKLGFARYGKLWLRKETKITINEISTLFPNVLVESMDRKEVFQVLVPKNKPNVDSEAPRTKEEIESNKTKIELESSVLLGINYLGQEVYESVEGRYIRGERATVTKENDSTSALFLRGKTDNDIEICADGLVTEIVAGRFFRAEDIDRFMRVVLEDDKKDDPIYQRKFHDAISHALARRMISDTEDAGPDAFALSIKLHEGLPPLNAERAERITPLPVGIVIQRLMNESNGKRAYLPQVGNGSIASALDGFSIKTNEVLGEGLSYINGKYDIEYVADDVPGHDVMAFNFTAEKLDKEISVKGLKTDRADHAKLLEALSKRSDKGRSVVLLKDDEASREFLSTIASSHELNGVVRLDASLFGKGGVDNGRLLVCIGEVGSCDFNNGKIKDVFDYGSLWSWSDNMVSDAQKANEKKSHIENNFQSPYIPASKATESTAMIPRNLAGPTYSALNNVKNRHGDIDEFVSKELQIPVDELGKFLDAGQVDAVALAIDAHLRGRFFIEADQTGMGKGRVLAAMARYSILNGMKTIFITERPTLFSDFFRDIRDTGNMDFIDDFVFNANQSVSLDGKKIRTATPAEDVQDIINRQAYPEDKNLVMATYTQFNKKHTNDDPNPKVAWLQEVAKDAFLILDESHNAGGESNTGENIHRAIIQCRGCIFSSATFAKNPANFFIYNRVMPPAVPSSLVPDVLESGGEPLAEVFSSMLAEDGVMIRREHDLSDLRFETEVDYAHMDRNEMLTNRFAEILEALGVVSGELAGFVNDKNRLLAAVEAQKAAGNTNVTTTATGNSSVKLKNIGWRSVGIGSILYAATRQFMMAIKTDKASDLAIKALTEGRKPVIVIENTMESLILQALSNNDNYIEGEFSVDLMDEDGNPMDSIMDVDMLSAMNTDDLFNEGGEAPDSPVSRKNKDDGRRKLMAPVTFNNVLHKILDRMMVIQKVENGSVTEIERVGMQSMIQLRQNIEMLIDSFPPLQISPIDIIKQKIQEKGYSCGEISGRSIGIVNEEDGSQSVVKLKNKNKTKIIHDFNEGYLDALVLTTAGSTGISLHSSRQFSDQRTREMIELQIPNNVATRIQCFGRVNRKDQRCPPIIRTITSGMPSEIRLLSMQNAKLREMSANTTSNRNNSILDEDFPDILNKVGSFVCMEYLLDNLDIARKLCIDDFKLNPEYWAINPISIVNLVTQRLGMLNVETQRNVYDQINMRYMAAIEELNMKGINPFKTSEFDIKANIISEDVVYETPTKSGSVFDAPIALRQVEYLHKFKVANMETVNFDIEKSNKKLMDYFNVNTPGDAIHEAIKAIDAMKDSYIERCLPSKFETVKEALDDPDSNAAKSAWARMNSVRMMILKMAPGNEVTFRDFFKDTIGVITDLKLPKPGGEHLLSEYMATIEIPGSGRVRMSMYNLINDSTFTSKDKISPTTVYKFNEPTMGSVMVKRNILCGNMFEAASWSRRTGVGTSVIYTDANGERHRGVMLPENSTHKLDFKVNVPIEEPIAKQAISEIAGIILSTTQTLDKTSFRIFENTKTNVFNIRVPSGKAADLLVNRTSIPELKSAQRDKRGVIASQTIEIRAEMVEPFINEVYTAGLSLYAQSDYADRIKEMTKDLEEARAYALEAAKVSNTPKM